MITNLVIKGSENNMSSKNKLKSTLLFAGATTLAIHLFNKYIAQSALLNQIFKTENNTYYDSVFGKIYYKKEGSGSPVLLIHDFNLGSSSYEWAKVQDALSETHTVYTIDLLGCGRSDKPQMTYTNYIYVKLLTDFINHVIGEKTDLIVTGESSAFALMASSLKSSENFGDLILVNPASILRLSKSQAKYSKYLKKLICTPIFGTFIYNLAASRKNITSSFKNKYYESGSKLTEREIDTYYEAAHLDQNKSKYLFSSIISGYMNVNLLFGLQPLEQNYNGQVTILVGDSNPENITTAEAYQNKLNSINIKGIPDTKHLPQLENPQAVTSVIEELLDK